jgi:hypothetical protein
MVTIPLCVHVWDMCWCLSSHELGFRFQFRVVVEEHAAERDINPGQRWDRAVRIFRLCFYVKGLRSRFRIRDRRCVA